MFHNSIYNMLSHPEKFTYENDEKTLSYIKAFLFNDKRAQLKKQYLDKNIFIEIDSYLRDVEGNVDAED